MEGEYDAKAQQAIGQVISGGFDKVIIRQKSGMKLEIGELLLADAPQGKILLQLFD